MTTQALVNPELLSWARIRSDLSEGALAKKINVKIDRIMDWEHGKLKPTFRQAQNIARVTNTPFGYLFLPKPPVETLPIPDLRTLGGNQAGTFSTELRDIIEQVLHRQDWYRDYLKSHGEEELDFVGKFTVDASVKDVVADIRKTLDIGLPQRGSWDDYQRDLIEAAEAAGVLVMRSGIVGNNTRRKLQVSEFRGFAISDSLAPIIFINSSDAPKARLFTLIHELAHIWLGESGISDGLQSHAKEEVFCNAVAGEFLVPEGAFTKMWQENNPLMQNLTTIAPRFHVSRLVVARRALDVGFISQETYQKFYQAELDAFRNQAGGGGDFYRTAGAKNSLALSGAVVTEALSGRMLLRDAGQLLGVAPHSIKTYARKIGL
jgi:Zn-dependent peptidase ImmA (M78 family)/transcriptional regulator with XRE-family HTH domain